MRVTGADVVGGMWDTRKARRSCYYQRQTRGACPSLSDENDNEQRRTGRSGWNGNGGVGECKTECGVW